MKRHLPTLPRPTHQWIDDGCLVCGLLRFETWTLNRREQAVMLVVWTTPTHQVLRVLEFAFFTGMAPPTPPCQTRVQAYPDTPVGGEPVCPGQRSAWAVWAGPSSEASTPRPALTSH